MEIQTKPDTSVNIIRYFFRQFLSDEYKLEQNASNKPLISFEMFSNMTFKTLCDDSLNSLLCKSDKGLYDEIKHLYEAYDINDDKFNSKINSAINIRMNTIYSLFVYDTLDERINIELQHILIAINNLRFDHDIICYDINGVLASKLLNKYIPVIISFQIEHGYEVKIHNHGIDLTRNYITKRIELLHDLIQNLGDRFGDNVDVDFINQMNNLMYDLTKLSDSFKLKNNIEYGK